MRRFILLGLLILFPLLVQAEQEQSEKVMIILDASGSMWGKSGNAIKIDSAKSAVGSLVDSWDKNVALGLMTYGHRRKGDCTDIETIVPLGRTNPEVLKQKLAQLNPKGMTPLSDSVLKAAKELKYSEQKATIILVSDGIESCDKDPCKIAERLEADGVDFTAHIVGFDLSEQDQKKIRCIAENTGGSYFNAKDTSSLQSALESAVESAVDPTGVRLQALMTEGGEPIEKVAWEIYKPKKEGSDKSERLTYSYQSQPFFHLPAGKYTVKVKAGNASASKEIEVVTDKNSLETVILGAGKLKISAVQVEGGEPLSELAWNIFETKVDLEGKRNQIAYSYDDTPIFSLPAGSYLVEVKQGSATSRKEVVVKAGSSSTEQIVLGSGFIKLQAALHQGAEVVSKDLAWNVFEYSEVPQDSLTAVTYSYDAQPQFSLASGKYVFEVKLGSTTKRETFEVLPGQKIQKQIILGAGMLKLSAHLSEESDKLSKLAWNVFSPEEDFDGNRKSFGYSYDNEPIFTLPAGEYLISVKHGATTVSQIIAVESGQKKRDRLVLNAGQVKLSAVSSTGGDALKGTAWNILASEVDDFGDGKRKQLAYSYDSQPIFTLPAGEYLASVKIGERSGGQTFKVSPGVQQKLEVLLE